MNLIFLGNWWHNLRFEEQVFWTIAVIFTILFVLQLVTSIMGIDIDSDFEIDVDTDFDGSIDTDGHFDVDPGFTLFSVRSIIAFFTFFGWVGVISLSGGMDIKLAIFISFISGLIALVFVAFVLYQLVKLAEVGNVEIEDVLGKYGKVYLPIPANREGIGYVTVDIGNKIMELRSVTDGDRLETGTIIYIFKILEDNILLVGKIKDKE